MTTSWSRGESRSVVTQMSDKPNIILNVLERRTEATRLYIAFLPGGRIGICIAERSTRTDG